jgi:hypothetical protein
MKKYLCVLVFHCVFSVAVARSSEPVESEIEGEWVQGVVVVLEPPPGCYEMIYGREFDRDHPLSLIKNRATVRIQGDRCTFFGQNYMKSVKIKVDPSTEPKSIDFMISDDLKLLGVYEVSDEGQLTFTIGNDRDRPVRLNLIQNDPSKLSISFSPIR